MWSEGSDKSGSGLFGARESIGPLFLTLAPPPVAIALVTCMTSNQANIMPEDMWNKITSFDLSYIFSMQLVNGVMSGISWLYKASVADFSNE